MSAPSGSNLSKSGITGYKQVPVMSPEKMKLFQSLLGKIGPGASGGLDYLSKLAGGDEATFQQMEAPSHRAFQGKLGDIATRFSGYGAGAQDSSAFQNATSGAASEFAENLGARRHDIQQSAIDRLLNHSQQLLGQQDVGFQEEGVDWGDLIGKLGPQALELLIKYGPAIAGFFLGGPGGAAAGGAAGAAASKAFS